MAMAPKNDAASAKSVCDQAVRAGRDITPLDREDAVRMRQIPCLATSALFEAGQHQLGAHGSVPDKAALDRGVVEKFFVHIRVGPSRQARSARDCLKCANRFGGAWQTSVSLTNGPTVFRAILPVMGGLAWIPADEPCLWAVVIASAGC
jgi:hypothetical protein